MTEERLNNSFDKSIKKISINKKFINEIFEFYRKAYNVEDYVNKLNILNIFKM